jgi:hypothetical protein
MSLALPLSNVIIVDPRVSLGAEASFLAPPLVAFFSKDYREACFTFYQQHPSERP